MIPLKLKQIVAPWYRNLRGWRTERKIVVIESDDWGSIRMPSREVYQKCLSAGYRVDQNPYERYDSLASESDLEALFDTLSKYRDKNGRHPIITANCLTANPDFDQIRKNDYREYFFESIAETFKSYPEHGNCLDIWRQGYLNKLFFPQSHGREHLNVSRFMEDLRNGNSDVHFGFKLRMPGILEKGQEGGKNPYVVAIGYRTNDEKQTALNAVVDGLNQFEDFWGFPSKSFIPPNYTWSPDFDKSLAEKGVRYFQGLRKMKEPSLNEDSLKLYSRRVGQKNRHGQIYLTRNCTFEPSLFRQGIKDPVDSCLRDISVAFRLKKPAIITSHRLNYVGFIDIENRQRNLVLLRDLLNSINQKWPEVEFMNSVELGGLIEEEVG